MAHARRLLALATCILIIIACALPSRAQDVPPQIEVKSPGRGPLIAKPRRFVAVPVLVDNTNGTGELQALLKVYRPVDDRNASPWQSVFYERTITVSPGGKRVESLVYYCQEGGDVPAALCVSLEPKGRPAITAFPKLEMKPNSVLVLSLTGETGTDPAAYVFQSARLSGPGRVYEVIEKKVESNDALPERPEGYEPWDCAVIGDAELGSLGNRQKALLDWVRSGGELIVHAGKGSAKLDPSILPVRARAGEPFEERSLEDLKLLDPAGNPPGGGKVPVRRVELDLASDLIAGTTAAPLIARRRLGAGYVTYLAFSIDAAPLERWGSDGRRALVDSLLRPPREELMNVGAPAFEELEQALSACIRQVEPPSGLLVGPLLTIYVLLVAPFNYFILSRFGRRELSFGSAGVLAVVFSAAFYGIGVLYKGSQSLSARSGVIELATRAGEASRVETMTGWFSTDNGNVDATVPAGASIAPIAERREAREAHVVLPFAAPGELRQVQLATWALRRFRERRAADLGAVEVDLAFKATQGEHRVVRGTVKNATKLKLQRPTLYFAGGAIAIAGSELDRGAIATVESWPGTKDEDRIKFPSALLSGVQDAATRALSEAAAQASQNGYAGGFGIQKTEDTDPRHRVLAMIERRLAAVDAGPDGVPALLVAWSDEDVGGIDLGSARRELQRSIVLVETRIRLAPSPDKKDWAEIAHLRGRVVFERGWETATNILRTTHDETSARVRSLDGVLDVEFRLPANAAAPTKALEIDVHPKIRAAQGDQWVLQALDWTAPQSNTYVAFARGNGNTRDSDAESIPPNLLGRCFDPTSGKLRIRVLYGGDGELAVDGLSITAKVGR